MTVCINIPTSDSIIWGLDNIVIDVCVAMSKNKQININLLGEGPDLHTTKLYTHLQQCAENFNYNLSNVTITTANLLEAHNKIKIVKYPPMIFVKNAIEKLRNVSATKENTLLPFGAFFGRGSAPRIEIATFLDQLDNSIISYHYDLTNEFHIPHCSLNEVMHFRKDLNVVAEAKFISKCPVRLDNENVSYPISDEDASEIFPYYSKFLIELICETYYSGKTFFPNEKTWRAIMLKTPFIIHGPVGFLSNLKKMGFMTFDQWWDEGYDCDPPEHRMKLIKKVIIDINKKTGIELLSMYREMHNVLEHNYNTIIKLTAKDFYKII
jgi:hypothetical protein